MCGARQALPATAARSVAGVFQYERVEVDAFYKVVAAETRRVKMREIVTVRFENDGGGDIELVAYLHKILVEFIRRISLRTFVHQVLSDFIFMSRSDQFMMPSSVNFILRDIAKTYNQKERERAKREKRKPEEMPHILAHILSTIALRIRKESSGKLSSWMKFRLCKWNFPIIQEHFQCLFLIDTVVDHLSWRSYAQRDAGQDERGIF